MHWIWCLLGAVGLTVCGVVAIARRGDVHPSEPARSDAPIQVSAPEIDPTTLTGPLILLTAGTLILTDRYRRAGRGV